MKTLLKSLLIILMLCSFVAFGQGQNRTLECFLSSEAIDNLLRGVHADTMSWFISSDTIEIIYQYSDTTAIERISYTIKQHDNPLLAGEVLVKDILIEYDHSVYWSFGYVVVNRLETFLLDDKKKPLGENIIVWDYKSR